MTTNKTVHSLKSRLLLLAFVMFTVHQTAWADGITYTAIRQYASTTVVGMEYRNLIDGNKNTQWCCVPSQNPIIEFEASEPIIPLGYVLTTGYDTKTKTGYNPTKWIIYAKVNKNDTEWTTIASETNNYSLPPLNKTDVSFHIEDVTTAYKYFQFQIKGSIDGSYAQLAEFAFITSADITDFNKTSISGIHPYYKYTGSNIAINYIVKDIFSNTLSESTDFTASYTCNGNAVSTVKEKGTYTLTLTGKEPYSGIQTVTFTVGDGNPVDLATLTEDYTAQTGEMLTGILNANVKVSIADGATVTLFDANIDGADNESYKWAGLTCLGDATIILTGSSYIRGFERSYPGIYVPQNKTLTIKGEGSLEATTHMLGAGIGGGWYIDSGNIVIESGTIIATNTSEGAGIGCGADATCGNITIIGGNVTAKGGYGSAGIGGSYKANCGDITINNCIVRATKGDSAPYSIGAGLEATSGTVTIGGVQVAGTPSRLYTYPMPIYNGIIDLSTLTAGGEILDGSTLTGTLGDAYQLTLVDGATVTLDNVTINGIDSDDCMWSALNCLGDATIILKGSNTLRGFSKRYSAIYAPVGKTLTIKGTGSLIARNNGFAAGIGGGPSCSCGNIVIEGGTIDAEGSSGSAGIGGSWPNDCGNITITGGKIRAVGGEWAAAIGGGHKGVCGNVTITSGVDIVFASTCFDINNSIGAGVDGTCGTVTIGGVVGPISEKHYYFPKQELSGTVDLSKLVYGGELQDGATVTGKLSAIEYISIADGATITLKDVEISGVDNMVYQWAGLNCKGNATVILENYNYLKGFYSHYPGIHVPFNKTLTLKGNGALTARSNGYAPGIGGGHYVDGGNIVIEGGIVDSACDGYNAAGIGGGCGAKCGTITITDGVALVTAKKGAGATYSIGAGDNGTCGTVTIGGVAGAISTSPYTYMPPTTSSIYTATDGTAGAKDEEGFAKLVDGSIATKWCVTQLGNPTFIEFETADPIIPGGYTMITGNDTKDNPGRNPKSWVVKAKANSNDDWTTLAVVENDTRLPAANYRLCTYDVENPNENEYKYFRLEISAIQSETIFQLSEFSFVIKEPKESRYVYSVPEEVIINRKSEWTTVPVDVTELEFHPRPYGKTPNRLRVAFFTTNEPYLVNQADNTKKIQYKLSTSVNASQVGTNRMFDWTSAGSPKTLYVYVSSTDLNAAEPGIYTSSLRLKTMWWFPDGKYEDNVENSYIPVTLIIPEGIATGNIGVEDSPADERTVWYTLDGRRLSNKPSRKGVYIMNGKRVVVK